MTQSRGALGITPGAVTGSSRCCGRAVAGRVGDAKALRPAPPWAQAWPAGASQAQGRAERTRRAAVDQPVGTKRTPAGSQGGELPRVPDRRRGRRRESGRRESGHCDSCHGDSCYCEPDRAERTWEPRGNRDRRQCPCPGMGLRTDRQPQRSVPRPPSGSATSGSVLNRLGSSENSWKRVADPRAAGPALKNKFLNPRATRKMEKDTQIIKKESDIHRNCLEKDSHVPLSPGLFRRERGRELRKSADWLCVWGVRLTPNQSGGSGTGSGLVWP